MNFCRETYWKGMAWKNKPWIITPQWGPEDVNWAKTESSSRFLWTWQQTSSSKNSNIYWPAVFTDQLNDFTAFERLSSMTLASKTALLPCYLETSYKKHVQNIMQYHINIYKKQEKNLWLSVSNLLHIRKHQYYKRLLPYNSITVVHMKPANASNRKYSHHSLVIMWLRTTHTSTECLSKVTHQSKWELSDTVYASTPGAKSI